MTVHDVQEGLGETGRFGEFFVGLGALIFVAGVLHVLSPMFGFPLWPLEGDEPVVQAIQVGVLFAVEGLGFMIFGVMAVRSGWARHHQDSDF